MSDSKVEDKPTIHYDSLLRRYMEAVIVAKGTSFLDDIYFHKEIFTLVEILKLREIENEIHEAREQR